MSKTANRVAAVIDQLIPGQPAWGPARSITCFVAKEGWTSQPITLIGNPRDGEPRSSRSGRIRIAVTNNVLPGAYQRFAFQLAHELAHVKMDPRVDNKIIETFAVAISLEVISRMGYSSFVETNEHFYAEPLPAELKAAIAQRDFESLSMYLRYKWHNHEFQPSDYSLQLLGAILIRAEIDFPWPKLHEVALKSNCRVDEHPAQVRWCSINELIVPEFAGVLEKLGLNHTGALILRISSEKPRSQTSFAFRESNHWVELRYISKQETIPAGYSVAE